MSGDFSNCGKTPLLVLAGLFALFVLVRASSPVDLLEGDQGLQADYIMDLLHGGGPAVQYEVSGRIATKPPLYNWLAVLAARTLGTAAPWVIKLPSLLAGAGLVWIIFLTGRNMFGVQAGLLGAGACLASFHFMRLAWLARTDMVMVFLLHLAVYLTMTLRKEPLRSLVVGLALGACFLTKGPVGPLFYLGWLLVWGIYGGAIKIPRAYLAPSARTGRLPSNGRAMGICGLGRPRLPGDGGRPGAGPPSAPGRGHGGPGLSIFHLASGPGGALAPGRPGRAVAGPQKAGAAGGLFPWACGP